METSAARVIDITNIPPEAEIKQEIASYVTPLKSFAVVDNDTMAKANETIKEINSRLKTIDQKFDPALSAAKEAKRKAEASRKALDDLITELKKPYEELKLYLAQQGKIYLETEEKKRREEERRLAEIARKEEEERRLAEALQAEQEGHKEEAEQILNEEVYCPPPVVEKSVPKVDNRLFAKRWVGEGKDIMAAIRFISAHPEYKNLLTFDATAINSMARSIKGKCPVDGIVFFER